MTILSYIILSLVVGFTYYAGFLHGRTDGRVEGYAEALNDEQEAREHD